MQQQKRRRLWDLSFEAIVSLESERGILASARHEAYGCIFGRDSLLCALQFIKHYERSGSVYFRSLAKKILVNLSQLQGTHEMIESGEEPGKIIHEYRPDDHEHLTRYAEDPWYTYPDDSMRNFDSLDATPLYLLAMHAYFRATYDHTFIDAHLKQIKLALDWILKYGDTDGDGLLDYRLHPERSFGGLPTQSWMDSHDSIFFEATDESPRYPVAPVEVQAYAWAALHAWGAFFAESDYWRSHTLTARADALKQVFNERFVIKGARHTSLAFAIDGRGRKLTSPRSSMGHCLFAIRERTLETPECILDDAHVSAVAARLMQPDLFVPEAGIRTLSTRSRKFNANSYHNGSIWPHDTIIVALGLEHFGYREEAEKVRNSILNAYEHFETPIELFVYSRKKFKDYVGPRGQRACKTQAWSAAALLSMLEQ